MFAKIKWKSVVLGIFIGAIGLFTGYHIGFFVSTNEISISITPKERIRTVYVKETQPVPFIDYGPLPASMPIPDPTGQYNQPLANPTTAEYVKPSLELQNPFKSNETTKQATSPTTVGSDDPFN